ncbi:MAG: hypothetical protein HUK23_06310, partial [Sphaerochaetaceae bacterium]|nr:hypothetical protein [Sphaerochaetaceae bacterium]
MANENTAITLLNNCNKQYRLLCKRYGKQAQCAKEALEKLIDMLVVEIYFDKHIKSLLPSDEMAGFIMDIKPSLPNLINHYKLNSAASFNTYIRRGIEIKAFTYNRKYIKKERIKESYLLNYYP